MGGWVVVVCLLLVHTIQLQWLGVKVFPVWPTRCISTWCRYCSTLGEFYSFSRPRSFVQRYSVAIAAFVVFKGVEGGIEKASKFMIPTLFSFL